MPAVATPPAAYQRHAPEHDLLHQVLTEHLETFRRYRLAYDGYLLTDLLRAFMQHLAVFYRAQARRLGHNP